MKLHHSRYRRISVPDSWDFRLYLVGQFVSLVGTWTQLIGQHWLVLQLTNDVRSLAVMNLVGAIPLVLISLFCGSMADRFNCKHIILVTQTVIMLAAFLMFVLTFMDKADFRLILLMVAVIGTAASFDLPAQQVLLSKLVGEEEIGKAVAVNQIIVNAARLIGPAIGGALVARIGIPIVYLLNGLSFVPFIGVLAVISLNRHEMVSREKGTVLNDVAVGLRYVWQERYCFWLLCGSAVTMFCIAPVIVVLPAGYVKDALRAGPDAASTLLAVIGVALLMGSASAVRLLREGSLVWLLMGGGSSSSGLMLLSVGGKCMDIWFRYGASCFWLCGLHCGNCFSVAAVRS